MEPRFKKGANIYLAFRPDLKDVAKYRVVEVLMLKECYRIKEIRRGINPYSYVPETRTFEEVHKAFVSAKTLELLYG